jgi:hypothetical protein
MLEFAQAVGQTHSRIEVESGMAFEKVQVSPLWRSNAPMPMASLHQ